MLTPSDRDRIGILSPAVEEYVLQRCGVSLSSNRDIAPVMECARPMLSEAKTYFSARYFTARSERHSPDEIGAGMEATKRLIRRLQAADPAFERKFPILLQHMSQISLLSPSQWAKEAEAFYWSIK